ncbi:hypothetical protein MNEG_4246 [Monoraphidium neglectum]|uniref:Peptidase C1A papain C-terminal domain-containing protein n=1 Tax=Monoraphidium neglectum TaxID=145388 RepID=A0A0D2NEX6_9CHLO|nr:hypothetical protein MNEG_4246 [Monoraphidium neglectum]KIZ03711.1 hypothetical protein MNEG_4246 [Monoraphidium neglectum]|eukprot:XP_013902730.1 hypothetical protein MNEG_4246 [Monoraphidium neglectum]
MRAGQGLELPLASTKVLLGASRAQNELASTFALAKKFISDYANSYKGAAKGVCSQGGSGQRPLCAASGTNSAEDQRATMMVATAPQAYSSAFPGDTGGPSYVGPAKDQGDCHTCVAFVVAGAAQAALASVLQKPGSNFDLSERQLFYCPRDPKAPRRERLSPFVRTRNPS